MLDRNLNQLFLAHDAFGGKTMYFYDKNFFAIASEIKGLLQYPLKKTINLIALESI
ncbi:MAG: hypothetical protein EOO42_11760 [Flavobacteriales bacterium]|nr:MAG: hypothetical protein EOO42_11760 [Flavobacteriales bacterium]